MTRPPDVRRIGSRRDRIDRRASPPADVDALGITVSAVGFGFVYGLSAREAGFSPIEAIAMSVLVFAGAAQFAAVGYVAGGLSVAGDRPADGAPQRAPPALRRGARARAHATCRAPRRALMAHLLTDEASRSSIAHFRRIGRADVRGYWIGAIVSTFIPWNLATLAGVTLGGADPGPGALRHRRHLPGRDGRAGRRADHGPARAGRGDRRRRRRLWRVGARVGARRPGSSPAASSGRWSGWPCRPRAGEHGRAGRPSRPRSTPSTHGGPAATRPRMPP